ncbi:hypothetical protein M0R45_008567 [Rubus argutus]|uniref:Uncharacterized protein n=1 Tax=Rubus argutus TaxID=59490 RepID=A0AAW1Y1Y8_RUBAR
MEMGDSNRRMGLSGGVIWDAEGGEAGSRCVRRLIWFLWQSDEHGLEYLMASQLRRSGGDPALERRGRGLVGFELAEAIESEDEEGLLGKHGWDCNDDWVD